MVILSAVLVFISIVVFVCTYRCYQSHSHKKVGLTQIDSTQSTQSGINKKHFMSETNRQASIVVIDDQVQEGIEIAKQTTKESISTLKSSQNHDQNEHVNQNEHLYHLQIEGDNHVEMFELDDDANKKLFDDVDKKIEQERQQIIETKKLNELEFATNVNHDAHVVENVVMDDILHHMNTSQ